MLSRSVRADLGRWYLTAFWTRSCPPCSCIFLIFRHFLIRILDFRFMAYGLSCLDGRSWVSFQTCGRNLALKNQKKIIIYLRIEIVCHLFENLYLYHLFRILLIGNHEICLISFFNFFSYRNQLVNLLRVLIRVDLFLISLLNLSYKIASRADYSPFDLTFFFGYFEALVDIKFCFFSARL